MRRYYFCYFSLMTSIIWRKFCFSSWLKCLIFLVFWVIFVIRDLGENVILEVVNLMIFWLVRESIDFSMVWAIFMVNFVFDLNCLTIINKLDFSWIYREFEWFGRGVYRTQSRSHFFELCVILKQFFWCGERVKIGCGKLNVESE